MVTLPHWIRNLPLFLGTYVTMFHGSKCRPLPLVVPGDDSPGVLIELATNSPNSRIKRNGWTSAVHSPTKPPELSPIGWSDPLMHVNMLDNKPKKSWYLPYIYHIPAQGRVVSYASSHWVGQKHPSKSSVDHRCDQISHVRWHRRRIPLGYHQSSSGLWWVII